jgi:hypothetical protein
MILMICHVNYVNDVHAVNDVNDEIGFDAVLPIYEYI